MVERAGCVCGKRGYGDRKFGGVQYRLYNVYTIKQDYVDRATFDLRKSENYNRMDMDRIRLRTQGLRVRTLSEECGTILVLYVM